MNINNFSDDIISYIYSFIPIREISFLIINRKIDERITRKILFQKFPNKCFICRDKLRLNYNLVMCGNYSLEFEDMQHYPIICHGCSNKKLKRGEYKFTFCKICNQVTLHLGITPFS